MHNGLTHAWLSSSLLISPREQIVFIEQLVNGTLPVSMAAHQHTIDLMYRGNLDNGWVLYGKTGNGYLQDTDEKQVGWFVGFVQHHDEWIVFSYLQTDDQPMGSYASIRVKRALEDVIMPLIEAIK